MRKLFLFVLCFSLVGCAYEGKKLSEYIQNPRTLVRDPHFTQYKEKRDALESQYLQKEITYAKYVEEMDELDMEYSKEVQERDAKISY